MIELPKLPDIEETEASQYIGNPFVVPLDVVKDLMRAYAIQAVMEERERCAKLCEGNTFAQWTSEGMKLQPHRGPLNHDGQRYAFAIRNQGEVK